MASLDFENNWIHARQLMTHDVLKWRALWHLFNRYALCYVYD